MYIVPVRAHGVLVTLWKCPRLNNALPTGSYISARQRSLSQFKKPHLPLSISATLLDLGPEELSSLLLIVTARLGLNTARIFVKIATPVRDD